MSGIKNVLFVDSAVKEHKLFVESCNSSTFPIVYSSNTTRNEVANKLARFSHIERIAFVFHESGPSYRFLNNEPLFLEGRQVYNSANAKFIVEMSNKYNAKNIDFLACNTLRYPTWRAYYDVLEKHTSAVVGASDDETGNLKYGGNWVMESTQENVKNIYFTSKIGDFSSLLLPEFNSMVIVEGTAYATGMNSTGELGMGNYDDLREFKKVTSLDGKQIVAVHMAPGNYLAADSSGKAYVIGDGVSIEISELQGIDIVAFSSGGDTAMGFIFALANDGTVYVTGMGGEGQLGTGTSNESTFTQVNTLSSVNVIQISSGYSHTLALADDGKVYATGANWAGQLGLGDDTPRSTFTEVTSLSGVNVVGISCNDNYSFAVADDGKVYATGENNSGQLGLDDTASRDTFTEVSSLSGIFVVEVSTGGAYSSCFSLALADDGTVYATGANWAGQLGLGDTTDRYTFTEVSSLDGIQLVNNPFYPGVSYSIVVGTDGNIYGTGYNSTGQLGLGGIYASDTFAQAAFWVPTEEAEGYATELLSDVTTNQTNSTNAQNLVNQSNSFIAEATTLTDTTFYSEQELTTARNTILTHFNTISSSVTTVQGYLSDVESDITKGEGYKTEIEGWYQETNNASIQESLNSVTSSLSSLESIKGELEVSLASLEADKVTITALNNEIIAATVTAICFPGNTPVLTDQGEMNINELVAGQHTIKGQKIQYITKVTNSESTLTCIRRDAIDEGIPSRKTVMTNDHRVMFEGEMVKAEELVDMVEGAFKVRYNGEPVYNVVLEKKGCMMVNGLCCETVNPHSRGLLSIRMIERVRNESNPEKKVRMAMAMRKVLRRMKLEDIRVESLRRQRHQKGPKN